MENLGDYLQLLFGHRRLVIQSAWRLVQGDQILVASGSDKAALNQGLAILVGSSISEANVHGAFHDLELVFESGAILQTFSDSDCYEHWNVIGDPQEMIVAGPGELWSEF